LQALPIHFRSYLAVAVFGFALATLSALCLPAQLQFRAPSATTPKVAMLTRLSTFFAVTNLQVIQPASQLTATGRRRTYTGYNHFIL
jgi:hypothetical protein